MAQNWDIDPKKRDYLTASGAPVETDSLRVPAYFRLKIKRTKWLYAPDDKYGSDYYTLNKIPPNNAAQIIENVGAAALQPMANDGRASSINVQADQISRNGVSLTTTIIDASGQAEVVTFPSLGV